MAELTEVLEGYDYAETIQTEIGGGKVNVELAEANTGRNPQFAAACFAIGQKVQKDNFLFFPEDEKIKIFCTTILKRWDVTHKGEPLEPKDAADLLTKNRAGILMYREMLTIAFQSSKFLGAGSKKKRSSTSTRRGSSSAKKPPPSPTRQKRAAKKSPRASKPISKD